MRRFLAAVALVCASFAGTSNAALFTSNYVFGDSLSDSGNLYLLTSGAVPASPYVNGHFTNGSNYAEDFSAALGIALVPSLAGGTNYAYGGARTTYHSDAALSGIASFQGQLSSYFSTHATSDSQALYTVYIGSNDVFDIISQYAIGNVTTAQTMLGSAVQTIATGLTQLVQSGATYFVVPTVPDLGLTPVITAKNSAQLEALSTQMAATFNSLVSSVLANLLSANPDLTIWRPDFFTLLDGVAANPAAYGLQNATDDCYTGYVDDVTTGTVCSNPESYLFWDRIHPTAAGHAVMGDVVLAAIPEPASGLLVLMAGAAMMLVRRQRGALRAH